MKIEQLRLTSLASFFLILIVGVTLLVLSVPAVTANPADSGAGIKGVVKFEGIAPKPTHIDMSPDPLCSKGRTTPATTEDIVIGGDGGLANVVVYISDGLASNAFQPPQESAVLEQKGCQYR